MTEDEAKTKWCPFARVAARANSEGHGTSGNRWPDQDDATGTSDACYRCIGPACMAWRAQTIVEWRDKKSGALVTPGTIILRDSAEERTVAVGGFCGLAGNPNA
jgi:hypothetical protein